MKRLVLITCLAGLLLAVTATGASALFLLDYNGHLKGDADSYVGFNLKKTASGKKKVKFFTTRGVPFACDTGSSGKTQFLSSDDAFVVKQGEFDGTSHLFTPAGDPVIKVHGELSSGKATGTLRLSGKLDPNDAGATCKTGRHSWRATRGE